MHVEAPNGILECRHGQGQEGAQAAWQMGPSKKCTAAVHQQGRNMLPHNLQTAAQISKNALQFVARKTAIVKPRV